MDYLSILKAARAAMQTAPRERASGCGRVYVSIVEKEHAKGIADAAKTMNWIFHKKGHAGMSNVLYIGYDNSTGVELGQGTAVAQVIKNAGISCYRDEQGD